MRKIVVLLLAAAVVSAAAAPAVAGDTDTFGASPAGSRRTFSVPVDRVVDESLVVRNHTAAPIRLTIYAADATIGSTGVVSVGFAGSPKTGLAQRVRVAGSVVLPGGAEKTVPIRIDTKSLPADARLGAIVVESSATGASGTFDVVERVAILIRAGAAGPAGVGGVPAPLFWPGAVLFVALVGFAGWRRARSLRRREPEAPVPAEPPLVARRQGGPVPVLPARDPHRRAS